MAGRLPKNSGSLVFIFFYIFCSLTAVRSQTPVMLFEQEQYDAAIYSGYASKKKIPDAIKMQVLTALSFYPELKEAKVVFRLKKRKTPLTSRPRISNIFKKKKNRTYVITISTETSERLAPILFQNLPYNAQVGVIGHELGHIAEYSTKNSFQILGLSVKILSSKFVDTFEFNTDRIAIEHGLGYQLYDWSAFVRKALNITEWQGASKDVDLGNTSGVNQRYMNTETIKKNMKLYDIYQIAE